MAGPFDFFPTPNFDAQGNTILGGNPFEPNVVPAFRVQRPPPNPGLQPASYVPTPQPDPRYVQPDVPGQPNAVIPVNPMLRPMSQTTQPQPDATQPDDTTQPP